MFILTVITQIWVTFLLYRWYVSHTNMTQIATCTVPHYRPQTSKFAPPPSSLRDPADGSRDTHLRTSRPNIMVLTAVGLSTPLSFRGSQKGGLATHARGSRMAWKNAETRVEIFGEHPPESVLYLFLLCFESNLYWILWIVVICNVPWIIVIWDYCTLLDLSWITSDLQQGTFVKCLDYFFFAIFFYLFLFRNMGFTSQQDLPCRNLGFTSPGSGFCLAASPESGVR